jgi:DNA-binding NarL/FixJ family response regulator
MNPTTTDRPAWHWPFVPPAASTLRSHRTPPPHHDVPSTAERLAALSHRELQVLGLMAEGRSNLAIARELVLSCGAIEKHVTSIFTKLGLAPSPDDHRRVLAVLAYLEP